MASPFEPTDFVRKAPQTLLREYCKRHGLLVDYVWDDSRHADGYKVLSALRMVGDAACRAAFADFRSIWDRHGRGFTRGLMNEASFHNDHHAHETLKHLPHLGTALWAALERPDWIANAAILSDVDSLPQGAWLKRKNLPARPGPVDQEMIERLEIELVDYFTKREYRGRNCKIDCLRHGEDEIFFTYAEDHPDTDLLWHEGHLKPQVLNRPFLLIFRHNDARRSLDIHLEGSRNVVPDLQVIFARAILGEEIPRTSSKDQQIYAIEEILSPGFQLSFPDELGIADARVTKMRFRLAGEPWRRFTAEADVTSDRGALDEFVSNLTQRLPSSRLQLDQVCIVVKFHRRPGDRRAPSRQVFITHPNSLRFKHDELGESIVQMLAHSGIERSSGDS
jgi:hypothetical protein